MYLDCTLTWRKRVEYSVCKFCKAKNGLVHFVYSDEINMANELLLAKTVLNPILLYRAVIFGKFQHKKNKVVQRKVLISYEENHLVLQESNHL